MEGEEEGDIEEDGVIEVGVIEGEDDLGFGFLSVVVAFSFSSSLSCSLSFSVALLDLLSFSLESILLGLLFSVSFCPFSLLSTFSITSRTSESLSESELSSGLFFEFVEVASVRREEEEVEGEEEKEEEGEEAKELEGDEEIVSRGVRGVWFVNSFPNNKRY